MTYTEASQLYVEALPGRGFCSEECVEKFYSEMVKEFTRRELILRKEFGLGEEELDPYLQSAKYLSSLVTSPDEVYSFVGAVDETYYTIMKHVDDVTMLAIVFIYDRKVSFVFTTSATRSKELVEIFRSGEKVENLISEDAQSGGDPLFELDSDFIKRIELLRGELFADLLTRRSDSDISFEHFHLYEKNILETIKSPDEIYKKDFRDEELYIYIKSFNQGQTSYFYLLLALDTRENDDGITPVPVLGFPTVDANLCRYFRGGEVLKRPIHN